MLTICRRDRTGCKSLQPQPAQLPQSVDRIAHPHRVRLLLIRGSRRTLCPQPAAIHPSGGPGRVHLHDHVRRGGDGRRVERCRHHQSRERNLRVRHSIRSHSRGAVERHHEHSGNPDGTQLKFLHDNRQCTRPLYRPRRLGSRLRSAKAPGVGRYSRERDSLLPYPAGHLLPSSVTANKAYAFVLCSSAPGGTATDEMLVYDANLIRGLPPILCLREPRRLRRWRPGPPPRSGCPEANSGPRPRFRGKPLVHDGLSLAIHGAGKQPRIRQPQIQLLRGCQPSRQRVEPRQHQPGRPES